MDNNIKTYSLEEVEPILLNAAMYSVNSTYLFNTTITDDPTDYDSDAIFSLAQECFLHFPDHDSDWGQEEEIWFPRNRNQQVRVKHGFIFYLYDNFGNEHEVMAYSVLSMPE